MYIMTDLIHYINRGYKILRQTRTSRFNKRYIIVLKHPNIRDSDAVSPRNRNKIHYYASSKLKDFPIYPETWNNYIDSYYRYKDASLLYGT